MVGKGNPEIYKFSPGTDAANLARTNLKSEYNKFILDELSIYEKLAAEHNVKPTLQGRASYLNKKGIKTRMGNKWHPTTVNRVMKGQ